MTINDNELEVEVLGPEDGPKILVAGGSYGGFIALEYAVAYPEHVAAIILRETSADNSNLERAFQNAREQTRVEINWDNFERCSSGRMTDDEDLKARWPGPRPAARARRRSRAAGRRR